MAAIIACYNVYANYQERVGMYLCEPARVEVCMYAEERGPSHFFALSDSFLWPH